MKKFNKVCHPEQSEGSQKFMRFFGFHPQNDKKAFTLAEILITLGVIGVVAAMTLPSVINKFRAKAFEIGFKKSYSNVNKAFLNAKIKLETDSVFKNYAQYDVKRHYSDFAPFKETFYNELKIVTKYTGEYPRKTYNGEQMGTVEGWCPKPVYILPDGSSIETTINSARLWLNVDTNGPAKGPNRFGFDIFAFNITSNNDKIVVLKMGKLYSDKELEKLPNPEIQGQPCSIKSNQLTNGVGCAWYAFNNVNPDDKTKTYWDNLPK